MSNLPTSSKIPAAPVDPEGSVTAEDATLEIAPAFADASTPETNGIESSVVVDNATNAEGSPVAEPSTAEREDVKEVATIVQTKGPPVEAATVNDAPSPAVECAGNDDAQIIVETPSSVITKAGAVEEASAATKGTELDPPASENPAKTGVATAVTPAEEPASKRQRVSMEESMEDPDEEMLDVCDQLGYKAGDRLEVEWQLEDESGKMVNKWWGCTILEHDGESKDGVAIRVLDYDPYPAGGFHERSQDRVIFLSHEIMISPEENAEFRYRAEGQVQFRNEEEARAAINNILMDTLNKHADKWKKLDRSQQSSIAAGIARKKELLVAAIMNHSKSAVINAEDMKEILSGVMKVK